MEKIAELIDNSGSIDIPTKQEIIEYALESKIRTNVETIHQEIEKGLKEAALGAAMMGVAAAGSQAAHAPTPHNQGAQINLSHAPKQHQEIFNHVAKKNPLLGAIGRIESSGGINYAHEPIRDPSSMHYGHVAGGMFGMMPNAASYVLRNDPELAKKYPHLVEAAKDMKSNHGVFTNTFNSNPKVAVDFAEALLKRNKGKTKNLEMLIHSWNHGLKGTWNKYKSEGPKSIKDAEYVQKVLKEYQQLAKKPPKKSLHKALTAGYGGAGKPSDLTYGGVLQSESIDDGRPKSFKYITCDECGEEQIHSKFQVKCRKCGSSFSLAKLHKVITS
jgi:hypothetical protein